MALLNRTLIFQFWHGESIQYIDSFNKKTSMLSIIPAFTGMIREGYSAWLWLPNNSRIFALIISMAIRLPPPLGTITSA